uniref:protein-tyrosine-phosphatase n=1 Tax=Stegastes partitus TaxID=144197 RepID=A0A3B5B0C8_9TELE
MTPHLICPLSFPVYLFRDIQSVVKIQQILTGGNLTEYDIHYFLCCFLFQLQSLISLCPPFTPGCLFVCHQCGDEERSLRQYWYTSWPDQKTPDKAPPLLELVQEVERAREEAPPSSGPTIVHCSAGIGRTGCFIATSILCKQLRTEGVVDILRTTCQLRLDRGGMIQTCEQYQFVHHVLSLYEKQLSHSAEE